MSLLRIRVAHRLVILDKTKSSQGHPVCLLSFLLPFVIFLGSILPSIFLIFYTLSSPAHDKEKKK